MLHFSTPKFIVKSFEARLHRRWRLITAHRKMLIASLAHLYYFGGGSSYQRYSLFSFNPGHTTRRQTILYPICNQRGLNPRPSAHKTDALTN